MLYPSELQPRTSTLYYVLRHSLQSPCLGRHGESMGRAAGGRRLLRRIWLQSGSNLVEAQAFENARPIFFEQVVRRAESDSNAEALECFRRGAFIVRKISVCQGFRQERPQGPGQIEFRSSGVGSNLDHTA